MLYVVPEAASSPNQRRRRLAVLSILYVALCWPRGSLVQNKSKEHHFCGALLTQRNLLVEYILPHLLVPHPPALPTILLPPILNIFPGRFGWLWREGGEKRFHPQGVQHPHVSGNRTDITFIRVQQLEGSGEII